MSAPDYENDLAFPPKEPTREDKLEDALRTVLTVLLIEKPDYQDWAEHNFRELLNGKTCSGN